MGRRRGRTSSPTLGRVRLREGVRALIIDDADNVLLVRFEWPSCGVLGGFWANPGGGVEPGESRLGALQRELREEVGLAVHELGPHLWTKTTVFPLPGWDGQVDHIYLQRVPHFDPEPTMSTEQLRAENVHETRWWPAQEIFRSGVVFAPRTLPNLLADVLTAGAPEQPLRLEGF